MSGNELPASHATTAPLPEQESRAGVVLSYGKVSPAEKKECDQAMTDFGFPDPVEGYRTIAKLFARSPRMQALAREEMHLAVLDPAKDPAA